MAGRPRTKPRIDTGRKRENYTLKQDKRGKTVKENAALKGFWTDNKMEDVMLLSSTELDKLIDQWLIDYQARQLKRDQFWWYPTMYYDPITKPKKKREINKSFNSTFIFK
jgi:hypothetical protein